MRFMIPFALLASLALFAGCESTSGSAGKTETCAACAAGEKCEDCAAKKEGACAACAAKTADHACATCAAGETCADCAAKKAKDKASAAPAGATEPVATIDAKGMGCPLCASSADRRLMKVDGVKWTNIDLGNGVVTVGLDPEKPAPSAEELQGAIRDAGFTADAVTMPDGKVTN